MSGQRTYKNIARVIELAEGISDWNKGITAKSASKVSADIALLCEYLKDLPMELKHLGIENK